MPTPKKLTTDNIQLSDMAKHYIEIPQVTSSGDTLQFNNNWTRDMDIYYVNTGATNLPLNKGIANGKPYGQGTNPATNAKAPGYDKVYAEIDGFKISGNGNLVIDVFPADKLALENADKITDDATRKSTLSKITLHQLPIAYLTDHYVEQKNADGSVKKDGNGNPVYQISSVTPFTVVYRAQANYHDPYNGTPDWYRKVVQGSGNSKTLKNGAKINERSKALALIEGLTYYLRGIDRVSYDYYTPSDIEIVDDLVDESAYNIVPSTSGLDGIKLSNAKLQTLLPNGIMSAKDINAGGVPENNVETAEDTAVVEDSDGPDYSNKVRQVESDLGVTPSPETTESPDAAALFSKNPATGSTSKTSPTKSSSATKPAKAASSRSSSSSKSSK